MHVPLVKCVAAILTIVCLPVFAHLSATLTGRSDSFWYSNLVLSFLTIVLTLFCYFSIAVKVQYAQLSQVSTFFFYRNIASWFYFACLLIEWLIVWILVFILLTHLPLELSEICALDYSTQKHYMFITAQLHFSLVALSSAELYIMKIFQFYPILYFLCIS